MIGRELEPRCLKETLEKDTVERKQIRKTHS